MAIAAGRVEGQLHDAPLLIVFHLRLPTFPQLLDETVEVAHELAGKPGATAKLSHLLDDRGKRRRIDLRRHGADKFPIALLGETDAPVLG